MKKRIGMSIFILSMLLVVSELVVYSGAITSKAEKSDAIIVLGCQVKGDKPSEFLKARTLRGKELYDKGYGEYIIVSGGKGSGENITEAEAMKNILIENGMPEEKILVEDKATSTMENIIFSKAIMEEKELQKVLVVSNKSHLTRTKMVCNKQGLDASFSGVFVPKDLPKELFSSIREIPALIKYYLFY